MRRADVTWRLELAAQTPSDIQATIDRDASLARERMRKWFESRETPAPSNQSGQSLVE